MRSRAARAGRAGFTLVEAMVTLSLLCFVVAVLGPLLLRVSRQSSSVTAGQYRTAAMVEVSSWAMTTPTNQLISTCILDTTSAFRHTTCSALTDTLPGLRRVRLIVTPADSFITTPDTLILYRVNTQFTNPFNSP